MWTCSRDGDFFEKLNDCLPPMAAWIAELIFGCEFGKDWYRENRDYGSPELLPVLDKHLETGGL